MKLRVATIDFETFWSDTHTLKKMSPIEYCMHPETELQYMAIKINGFPTDVFEGEDEIRHACSKLDWSNILAVGHNMSAFDAMILAWRLGIQPAMWGCTLAMARPIFAKTVGLSLAKLAAHFGRGVKNNAALVQTKGRKLKDFTRAERAGMVQYNKDDTDQGYGIFCDIKQFYTPAELWHIDCKIRGLVDPQFTLDMGLIETALSVERSNKHKVLLDMARRLNVGASGVDLGDQDAVIEAVRGQLASAPKFAARLESLGVEPPYKRSPTDPKKLVPALAKTDEAFVALQEHPDELVAAAAQARLSVKSTILETRLEAFKKAGNATGGKWPVTVHYCGADTTGRPSGWLYNPLNLPRINPTKPKVSDALRNSIKPPKGYKVVVSDSSGIELRFNHFLWKVPYSTRLWSADPMADLYRASASRMYSIEPAQVSKDQRQFHKVLNLACGYGMGPDKFRSTARVQGGIDLAAYFEVLATGEVLRITGDKNVLEFKQSEEHKLVRDESAEGVYGWREVNKEIKEGWATCHQALEWIYAGDEYAIDPWGMFVTCSEGIRLPSGRMIRYPNLRQERKEDNPRQFEWVYGDGRHKTRIYGGKIDENIVQAGARDVIYGVALEVFKASGFRPGLEVYDELAYAVPESEAEDFLKLLQDEMRKPTPWFPALVKWSEGDIADSYGAAK